MRLIPGLVAAAAAVLLIVPRPLAAAAAEPAEVQHARVLFAQHQYKDVIVVLTPYLVTHADDARAFVLRGDAQAEAGDERSALADYDRAIVLAPEYTYAYVTRCDTRRATGDESGALRDCNTALRLDPTDEDAYSNRAAVEFDQGSYDAAAADYDAAIAKGSNTAYVFAARCDVNRILNRIDRAVSDCARSLTIDPQNLRGLWAHGRLAISNAGFADATQTFNAYLRLAPDETIAYYWRGYAYNRLGSWSNALEDFAHFLSERPGDADTLLERGYAHAGSGDLKAAALDGDAAAAAYRKQGDLENAKRATALATAARAGNAVAPPLGE